MLVHKPCAPALQISVFKPAGAKLRTKKRSSDVTVAADPGRFKGFTLSAVYTYHDLPSHYWKKYQYASQFVQLVRSRTPKVGGVRRHMTANQSILICVRN